MNKGTNLLEKFELTKQLSKGWIQNNNILANNETEGSINSNQQSTSENLYSDLLENNFFSNDLSDQIRNKESLPKAQTSVKSKLFSFRHEQRRIPTNISKSKGIFVNSELFEESSDNYNYSRKINAKPYKIIEANGLLDDFYLNLLDWSSQNDIVVGQGSSVFLWCANKTQCVKLLNYEGDKYVTSVIWNNKGTEVAVGNSDGVLEIWDGNQYI